MPRSSQGEALPGDRIVGALKASASSFLLKRTSPDELIAAIHTVAVGDADALLSRIGQPAG